MKDTKDTGLIVLEPKWKMYKYELIKELEFVIDQLKNNDIDPVDGVAIVVSYSDGRIATTFETKDPARLYGGTGELQTRLLQSMVPR